MVNINYISIMKRFFVVILLIIGMCIAQAQEIATPEEVRAGEMDIHLVAQLCGHNYDGEFYPLTGIGIYLGYSHFFKEQHRLSGGVELAYRNGGGQVLFIPDYHYEWLKNTFRFAVGMQLMVGYCHGFGFATGLQPNVEFGIFLTEGLSLKLGIGYRVMGYPTTTHQVGNFLGEMPITIGITF